MELAFKDFAYLTFGRKNGTAGSYIQAIRILDNIFSQVDLFGLEKESLSAQKDMDLLLHVLDFVKTEERKYKKGESSIFRYGNPDQTSYPIKGFCSAAIKFLVKYIEFEKSQVQADHIVSKQKSGRTVSKVLLAHFDINKEGKDVETETRIRYGQNYFRRMVLANYAQKCCVTGLNVPQLLIASHIVAWADDKINRMNPENGLCLSATYDAAFDQHLISFDENYRMIVSKEIKDYYTNEAVNEYFFKFEGKKIILPNKYMPSQKLLEKHRSMLV